MLWKTYRLKVFYRALITSQANMSLLPETPKAQFDEFVDTHLKGAFFLAQTLLR